MRKITIKLTQKWGGYHAGDVVQFDESKGAPLLQKGIGQLAGRGDKALNVAGPQLANTDRRPPRRPKAETASNVPAAETMDVTPQSDTGDGPSAGEASARSSGRKAGE
jgi:hypothetical protein